MSDKMFGPEYQGELAKAYQAATGKPLPSAKMQKDILVKAAAIHKNISEHNVKQAGLNSGVNRDTNWVIQLQEI